jgi:hypothetical protein
MSIFSDTSTNNSVFSSLRKRYSDAYAVARGLVLTGSIIKFAGLVIGAVLLVAGVILIMSGFHAVNEFAGGARKIEGVAVIFFGLFTSAGCFISGTLMAAVGQFMSAGIDTAVNTSENVSPDEKAEILGLC